MISKKSHDEIDAFIEKNASWQLKDNKLHQKFIFKNFVQAFGFMTQAALIAERDDHHPEWFNVYKTVIVDLTTHEANGITERDFSLAMLMDKFAANMTSSKG